MKDLNSPMAVLAVEDKKVEDVKFSDQIIVEVVIHLTLFPGYLFSKISIF